MTHNLKREFVSSLSISPKEIKEILFKKIKEENDIVKHTITPKDIEKENEIFKNLHFDKNKINIVSLFSGAGGLDLGVEIAGFSAKYGEEKAYSSIKDKKIYDKLRKDSPTNFVYSNDMFEAANLTYKANFPRTVTKLAQNIQKISKFPNSNLMLGGFPCPGFSAAGPRLLDDPRNFLYIHYIRGLIQSQPEFFVAENVKGLMTMGKGEVLKQITEDFSASGYEVSPHLVNSRDYGVPQLRERVFIIGVRKDIVEKYNFIYSPPKATHGKDKLPFVTLHDAISDLPLNPDDVFDSSYSSMYMSRNRKKSWNEQSFTIQASGRQAPQHPAGEPMLHIEKDLWKFQGDFNRRLSVRECARIQTFPDWFKFSAGEKKNVQKNNLLNEQYKQIGNAVPVILAEKMVRPILEFLYEHQDILNQ
ncbi:DNA cytosine methyltransferase [Lactococcus lactis]|uniref:DNA cytosine methyltransferase n=1 Tax=Lactococcus lactis TaxID=1358 RepID=UPI0018991091|nr:DNA (cytosine-5-)-methyltransferase [Lactococcus lactis]